MTKINMQAAYRWVEHGLRRSSRRKSRAGAHDRIHKKRVMQTYKESFNPEVAKVEITISNYFLREGDKKIWFTSLQDGLDHLYLNHKDMFLSSKDPATYFTKVQRRIKLAPLETPDQEKFRIEGSVDLSSISPTNLFYYNSGDE